MTSDKKAFESVCERAGAERWCWNITCTTCGHMLFRYAFKQLVAGVDPASEAWVACKKNEQNLSNLLGTMPRRFPRDEQLTLARVLAEASLTKLVNSVPFPDWLGYMGLGLWYCADSEPIERALTMAWVPQLLEMVPDSSAPHISLTSILDSSSRYLQWTDLDGIERALERLGSRAQT